MKKKKIIFEIILTIMIIFVFYIYACFVFMPKNSSDRGSEAYFRSHAILAEKNKTLDVLLYGNSDINSAFSPMQMYDDIGVTSFVEWGNQQSMKAILRQFKRDLKKQSPQLVILEVDHLFYPNKFLTDTTRNDIFLLNELDYHVRWKELELNDFISKPEYREDKLKGWTYFTKNGEYKDGKTFMNKQNSAEISNSVKKDVVSFKNICDKKGIKLLFLECPSPSSWNMNFHDQVEDLADELKVDFIDLNISDSFFNTKTGVEENFDWNNFFRDNGNHVNFKGAKFITRYVTQYISENLDIPNKKDREEYSLWNKNLQYYKNLINE